MIEASLSKVQRFILETQGLISQKPVKSVMSAIKKIHNVQIDTISVVARSHDLIMHNRVLGYQEGNIWKYLKNGKLFEYWSHGMCLIPTQHYPFYAWKMKLYRESKKGWLKDWAINNKQLVDDVFSYVKRNGATPSKQLGKREKKGGGWWDWKAEKYALEYLFFSGKLMVAYREGFQKYYDITDRVLPPGLDSEPMKRDAIPEFMVKTILSSLGVASATDIKHYMGTWPSREIWNGRIVNIETFLNDLIHNHEIEEMQLDGVCQRYFILKKNLRKLQRTEENKFEEIPMKFLSPFDNIMRERHRPLTLWDFDYKIEAYTQAPKRKYGYYVLPILDDSQLVGRMDPKVHRNEGILEIKALYLEGEYWKDEGKIERLSSGIIEFSKFHECKTIKLGKTIPKKMKPILETSIESLF